MAEIFLAKLIGPGGFERAVVVKRVLPHLARRTEFRDMFLDEARIVARIRHPNVVDVTELGQDGRDLFMVMEYLAGESVAGVMRRVVRHGAGRFEPALAAHLIAEVAAGLHAAHELVSEDGEPLGLVHRDVSPQNVFLTYDGAVKLLDFGIAKFTDRSVRTDTGQIKGKFAYMSPEQCCAEKLDRRSDVFSLGIMLWELLTGRRLYQRANELLVWKAIVEEEAPSASACLVADGQAPLPEEAERILAKALARKREDRYPSADAMRRDLLALARSLDPEQAGRERLAELMRSLFPDRIAQKEEMLRRVRAGDVITSMPAAEVDVESDIVPADTQASIALGDAAGGGARMHPLPSHTDPVVPLHDELLKRRALMIGAAIVAVALMVGAVAVLGLGGGGDAPVELATELPEQPREALPEAALPPSSTIAPTSTIAPSSTATGPALRDEPTARTVRVHVDTVPTGAEVLVGDALRGVTPLELVLERGSAPVEITLRRTGYRDHVEAIVPDVDQRVRLTLTRAPAVRSRGAGRDGTRDGDGTSSRGGEFFRFD